ncbi:unnamed protein product [Arctogadus glacialis]
MDRVPVAISHAAQIRRLGLEREAELAKTPLCTTVQSERHLHRCNLRRQWIPDWAQVRFVDNHKQHPDTGGGIKPQPEGPESLDRIQPGPTGLSSITLTETPATPGVDVCPGRDTQRG